MAHALLPGSRGPNVEIERRQKENTEAKRRASGSGIENLTSMSVFGSDFEPCLWLAS